MACQLGSSRAEEREAEGGVGLRGLQTAVEQRLERRPGVLDLGGGAVAADRRPFRAAGRSWCCSRNARRSPRTARGRRSSAAGSAGRWAGIRRGTACWRYGDQRRAGAPGGGTPEQLFPHAVTRFRTALQVLPADQADSPFVQALVALVTLKDDRFRGHSGFIILPEWVTSWTGISRRPGVADAGRSSARAASPSSQDGPQRLCHGVIHAPTPIGRSSLRGFPRGSWPATNGVCSICTGSLEKPGPAPASRSTGAGQPPGSA